MIQLHEGDELPMVATVQLLLNSLLSGRRPLVVDGDYGPRTRDAVAAFQTQSGLVGDGTKVEADTWARLSQHTRLQVRDIVDVFDPALLGSQYVLEQAGGTAIVFGGSSNALGWVVPAVAQSGVAPGALALLRFQGHGNRGIQVVGYGTLCHVLFDAIRRQPVPPLAQCTPQQVRPTQAELDAMQRVRSHSALSSDSLALPEVVAALAPLRGYFAPSGSVEFHGCRVAEGRQGAQFLRRAANVFGVPAVAAQNTQFNYNAVRFGGSVRIVFPRGGNLRTWARRLSPILSSR